LFLQELNVDYEDVLYSYDETWPSVNKAKGVSLTGTLPILEIDDQRLYQVRALPILRENTYRLFKYPI
jgi:glutathione S-transferase